MLNYYAGLLIGISIGTLDNELSLICAILGLILVLYEISSKEKLLGLLKRKGTS